VLSQASTSRYRDEAFLSLSLSLSIYLYLDLFPDSLSAPSVIHDPILLDYRALTTAAAVAGRRSRIYDRMPDACKTARRRVVFDAGSDRRDQLEPR